jgi:serine/threonine-protein kinase
MSFDPKSKTDQEQLVGNVQAETSLIGTTLDRRYVIEAFVGRGGMSMIYRAKDLMLHRQVAIKLLLPHMKLESKVLRRFQQEAVSAARLRHPNIVQIHEFAVPSQGQPYMVMDYCQGKPLSAIIKADRSLEPERALRMILQACDALVCAHGAGVVHRDLKPDNFIVTGTTDGDECVHLVDFGIAKVITDGAVGALTETGEVFGSPLSMSPEQCRGQRVDARSDIYSLGCVLYEMLTGTPPFVGKNALETIQMQVFETQPALAQVMPNLANAGHFDRILSRAMAKDPQQRYQSISEMQADLLSLQKSPGSPSVSLAAPAVTQSIKKKMKPIAVVVSAIAVGLAGWLGFHQPSKQAQTVAPALTQIQSTASTVKKSHTGQWDDQFVEAQELMNGGEYRKANNLLQTLHAEAVTSKDLDDPDMRNKLVVTRLIECSLGLHDENETNSSVAELGHIYAAERSAGPSKEQESLNQTASHPAETLADRLQQSDALEDALSKVSGSVDPMVDRPLLGALNAVKHMSKKTPEARELEASASVCLSVLYDMTGRADMAKKYAQSAKPLVVALPDSPRKANLLHHLAVVYYDQWGKAESMWHEITQLCSDAFSELGLQNPDDRVDLAQESALLAYLRRIPPAPPEKNLPLAAQHAQRALIELDQMHGKSCKGESIRALAEMQLGCALQEMSVQQSPQQISKMRADSVGHLATSLRIIETPLVWKNGRRDRVLIEALQLLIQHYRNHPDSLNRAKILTDRLYTIVQRLLRTEKIAPLNEKEVVDKSRIAADEYTSLAKCNARLGQTAASAECLKAAAKISVSIGDDKSEAQSLERLQRELVKPSQK